MQHTSWRPHNKFLEPAAAHDIREEAERFSHLTWERIITSGVFANEIVLHVASVIIPLEHIGAPDAGGCRWLMVHDYADLAATGRLIHIPVPVGKGSTVEAIGEGY